MASAALPLTTVAVHDAPMHLAAGIPLTTGAFEAGEGPAAIRRGTVADAPAIHALINGSLSEGHLLPRTADDVARRATRFVVVTVGDTVVGCAELAPLSRAVAEVRSLVVDGRCRGRGFGSRIVEELNRWAVQEGFATLCAFTHNAAHFVRLGFSIVPHPWLPEKIATDCVGCPKFRQCTQYAMALPLRGRSLRTSPAGQRPYLAMPEDIVPIVPHQGRAIDADGTRVLDTLP
jgi:amino-acid N-acetyltransferase